MQLSQFLGHVEAEDWDSSGGTLSNCRRNSIRACQLPCAHTAVREVGTRLHPSYGWEKSGSEKEAAPWSRIPEKPQKLAEAVTAAWGLALRLLCTGSDCAPARLQSSSARGRPGMESVQEAQVVSAQPLPDPGRSAGCLPSGQPGRWLPRPGPAEFPSAGSDQWQLEWIN